MFISEAMAQGASGGSGFLIQIAPLVLIFAVFYFLLINKSIKLLPINPNPPVTIIFFIYKLSMPWKLN